MDDKLVELILNQGVPMAILLLIGLFVDRRIWPVFARLIDDISDAACRTADALEAMVDPDCLKSVKLRNSPPRPTGKDGLD